ncbi:MAG: hypothetical protein Q8L48_12285 [Archangium sp.]|nr:hypothetical protein [Archangium sp.]
MCKLIMGLFDGVQRWQRRRRAKAQLEAGDVEGAKGTIGADSALRHELAEGLLESGRLDLSQALLGHRGGSTFDALLEATPADPELERLLAEATARTLPSDARVLQISSTLLARGEREPALALLERAALSSRTWPLLRAGIEASCEAKSWERAWHLIEAGLGALKGQRGTPEHGFLLGAHALVLSHLESAEAVTADLMMRGEIPFSGRNHLLLARALMRDSPRLASRLTLVSAPQEMREGDQRLELDRKDATGLLLVGSAKLRLGELNEAADVFTRGRDVAPRHFGLVAGLGAAIALDQERALARVRALPDIGVVKGLEALLPDLEQLTTLEVRVAQASVKPLARWLPALADSRLRILPLDVRVTDLPDFEELRGRVEKRDLRSWDALGGLAGDGLACVRVEELFDTSELAWTLAHEFAHLVHQVLPEHLQQAIHAAWRKAKASEFAFDQYQLSNEHEFFAVTYTRWLCRRYGLAPTLEADTEGHLARAFECIDQAT